MKMGYRDAMAIFAPCAQVAINAGDQEEAERLSMVALEELPLASYHSRIGGYIGAWRSAALKASWQISGGDATDGADGSPPRHLALRARA